MKKLQKIIRRRMNISWVSAIRIMQSLKKIETNEKKFQSIYFEYGYLFVKEAFEEMIRSVELLFFLRLNLSVVVLVFDKRVGFRQFLVKGSFEGS